MLTTEVQIAAHSQCFIHPLMTTNYDIAGGQTWGLASEIKRNTEIPISPALKDLFARSLNHLSKDSPAQPQPSCAPLCSQFIVLWISFNKALILPLPKTFKPLALSEQGTALNSRAAKAAPSLSCHHQSYNTASLEMWPNEITWVTWVINSWKTA